jgi:hypothetical protein
VQLPELPRNHRRRRGEQRLIGRRQKHGHHYRGKKTQELRSRYLSHIIVVSGGR